MAFFKKKKYSNPVISKHCNDVTKDWYVFFSYKFEGKIYKFKRREGINRVKELDHRLNAIHELLSEILYDLQYGWNPILDPKRENDYNPYLKNRTSSKHRKTNNSVTKQKNKRDIYNYYINK